MTDCEPSINEFAGPRRLPASVAALLGASPLSCVAVDEQGVIIFANSPASRLFGYPITDLVGRPGVMLTSQTDEPTVQAWRGALLDHSWTPSHGHLLALTMRRRDGSEFPVELNLTHLDLGDGCRWTVAAAFDVSARVEAERAVAHLNRAYLMLAQLNRAAIVCADAQSLFASTTRICVEQGGFVGSSVAAPTPDGHVKMLAMAGDLDAFVTSLVITLDPQDPHGRGPTARALRDGETCFVSDFLTSDVTAPWHEAALQHGVGAVVALPLRTDGRVVASLSIYADGANAFDEGVAELFTQVADNVSHALDGFAAEQSLAAEVGARHDLLKRLMTAEETERGRIAAGIHDDSVQSLAAVELRLGLLLRKLGDSPEVSDLATMVRTISTTVSTATTSLRNLLFELEPPLLAQDLDEALGTVARHVFEDEKTTWSLRGADEVALPDAPRAQALRIVKEALINIRKHASATHVEIRVRRAARGVELTVTDDGVGLAADTDPDRLVGRRGHRGLETMRDRAAATGGWCRLERAPTGGVSVRFFIPVSQRV